MMPLSQAAVTSLHRRVRNVWACGDQALWAAYGAAACELPAWVRENGLLQALHALSVPRSDTPDQDVAVPHRAAKLLMADWLQGIHDHLGWAPEVTAQAWSALGQADASYPLVSRIGHAVAVRLARSVRVLGEAEMAGMPSKLIDRGASLPRFAHPHPVHDTDHLAQRWRFGGERPAGLGRDAQIGRAQIDKSAHVAELVAASARKGCSDLYRQRYKQWAEWASQWPCTKLKVDGRLLLGTGLSTVHETGVLLHPVHGMPYLPGSALKGLLRAWLTQRVETAELQPESREQMQALLLALFGQGGDEAQACAGAWEPVDAWWAPDEAGPLTLEVRTPHHQAYHQGKTQHPSVFDSPIPVNMVALRGHFLLCSPAVGMDTALAKQVLDWLCEALADPVEGGLGGRAHAAGYGRLIRTTS
jgi:CRISPR type III-B/RAMP module RAMP protein Cmr6